MIERLTEDRVLPADELAETDLGMNEKVYAAGDFAEVFCSELPQEKISPAPVQLRNMKASSLCFAAEAGEMISPELLAADYLQLTKAEKDLSEKRK